MLKKLSKKTKLILVASIFYWFLPADLVPDYIIGFGQLDDLSISMCVLKSIFNDLKVLKTKVNAKQNEVSK